METNNKEIIETAERFKEKKKIKGEIKNVRFYDSFYEVSGSVWTVEIYLGESGFGGNDILTLVISNEAKKVVQCIGPNGLQLKI